MTKLNSNGRICWKLTVAETGNRSATKSTVAIYVQHCCRVQLCCQFWQQIGNNIDILSRSTLLPIRSTLLPVCTGPSKRHGLLCRLSTKSTVLNSTLSPVCTGLYTQNWSSFKRTFASRLPVSVTCFRQILVTCINFKMPLKVTQAHRLWRSSTGHMSLC